MRRLIELMVEAVKGRPQHHWRKNRQPVRPNNERWLVINRLLLLDEEVADDGGELWEDLVTVMSWKKVGGEARTPPHAL